MPFNIESPSSLFIYLFTFLFALHLNTLNLIIFQIWYRIKDGMVFYLAAASPFFPLFLRLFSPVAFSELMGICILFLRLI